MKLSIITINYNNKAGLEKTIASVMSQTWRDFEWLIIDGGSTDGSKEVIENLNANPNANISYWCSEKDKGVYNAMNKGIAKAKGDYLNFMNSGDEFFDKSSLIEISGFIEEGKADIYYADADFYDSKGNCFLRMRLPEHLNYLYYINGRNISHQASFIKKELLKKRPYNESYKLAADGDFFFYHLLHRYTFTKIKKVVVISDIPGLSGNVELAKHEVETFKSENLKQLSFYDKIINRLLYNRITSKLGHIFHYE